MLSIKKMDVGPIVGHADMDHVRLWGRASYEKLATGEPRRAFGVARIKKIDSGDYGSPVYFKMNPNFDMSGVAIFCGLKPDTKYAYQMGWFYSDKELEELNLDLHIDWGNSDIGEFVTSSDNSSDEKQFIFGSCRYLLRLFEGSWFDSRGDKTFRSILRQIDDGDSVDKFLMVGDQIYADDLNFLSPDKQVDEYLSRYRDVFSQKYMKKLMSKVSTYMTLDDHEIEDNWPSKAEPRDMMVKYPAAIHSYQIYQMSHSPIIPIDAQCKLQGVPEGFYYCFKDGCSDFFVTDTRTERDLEDREIISEFQMESLLQC
ncbi:alkaline phosphatase D family protein [Neptuniibacter sp.]|uniref:alkaline phosphatase D family protein n=1 Tax=Neptuniibacter sp. TaxID=1962643 RepID=UPI0026121DAF|nr:alkaline phosphatase D family protein [Neptuniibacter sp.]